MFQQRMKAVLVPVALACAFALVPSTAKADLVDNLVVSLINVNVEVEDVNVYINDVDILDYNYVNVRDVLNDVDIAVLLVEIEDSPIASKNQNFLNNLLQNAEILDDQIVVGVLSDQKVIYFLK
jgi:hypothetical protein